VFAHWTADVMKNINLTIPDYEEKVLHCSRDVEAVGMTPSNPQ